MRRLLDLQISPSGDVIGYRFKGDLSRLGRGDLGDALALVEATMQGAEPDVIIEELAKTDLVTARRQDSEDDTEARAVIFAQDLRRFPPDTIRASFERHRRLSKWAPTIADITEGCWQELRARTSLRALLRKHASGLV